MNEFLNYLERLALEVSRFIALLAGIVLLWIVLVTCVDVIGRYFFNSPLYAGAEIIQVSMAGVIFFSLPYMFFKNEHIIVDLFPIKTGIIKLDSTACLADSTATFLTAFTITAFTGPFFFAIFRRLSGQIISFLDSI